MQMHPRRQHFQRAQRRMGCLLNCRHAPLLEQQMSLARQPQASLPPARQCLPQPQVYLCAASAGFTTYILCVAWASAHAPHRVTANRT